MLFASISAASTAQLTLGIRRLNSGNWLWITAGKTHKSQTFPPLEPLGASLTLRIGKIAIERKADILHQGVDAKMIALGRLAALSHMVEGPVKLRQVFDFNH
jgi:hypothetical protein